jgi:hypothetical protein
MCWGTGDGVPSEWKRRGQAGCGKPDDIKHYVEMQYLWAFLFCRAAAGRHAREIESDRENRAVTILRVQNIPETSKETSNTS